MAVSGAEDAEAHAVAEPAAVPDAVPRAVRAAVEGAGSRLDCPSCGSAQVAQMLGDNGGVSYVCTSCGRSWS
ncbi:MULTISPECIES: hypothetical protein [unclassified Streptomyces]|uniref:hypothetical protein n=1 Tax=unclassified Streptomyces TaxID=2593676 RepID=UPI003635C83C